MPLNNKFKNVLSTIVEPFALGLLALLFIIPTITVVNLEPITKKLQQTNVLGVSNSNSFDINLVGGSHILLANEDLIKDTNRYMYTTKIQKHVADSYSKPILTISNNTEREVTITFYGGTELPNLSTIGLIIEDQFFKLQNDKGQTYEQSITVPPQAEYIVYLSVESLSGIQFSDDFQMDITW